ncbi:TPA: hypothetical protein ACKP70_003099, partial [Stenotrophomonas maltophilia]
GPHHPASDRFPRSAVDPRHAWMLCGNAGRWPATSEHRKSGIEERSDRLLLLIFFCSAFRG